MLVRRSIKGRKPHNKKRIKYIKLLIYFTIIAGLGMSTYNYLDKQCMPTLLAIAELNAKTQGSEIINNAVKEVLQDSKVETEELITYYYNSDGELTSIGINTIKINEISSQVIYTINEDIKSLSLEKIMIPFGHIIGSNVFANVGPNIGVELQPVGTTTINYNREFYSTGINQVNHRVWLDIETTIQVVVPMATEQITVSQQFTLIDNVINGVVPPNYINIPEDNVPNVIDY